MDALVEVWWPETVEAYQGGKELDFGWILVSQKGLRLDTSDMTPL
ncbi:hypothetical protein [Ktedonobacter sp. SOSP1-52]|nr:hypothetical protein [Ktedonobacter sp. SOSP1-52]